jgi:hypothetical protein
VSRRSRPRHVGEQRACIVRDKQLDDWRRKQDDLPGRPEAIRRLVELGLKTKGK